MDSLKNISKGGWHPGGQKGGGSSYSSNSSGGGSSFKGIDQVKGWMGKGSGGKNDPHERAANHQSTPLNQLRDPSSFGPPPKRTGTFGSESGSAASPPPQKVYEGSRLTASTGGLGAPLSRAQIEDSQRAAQEREEARRVEEEGPPKPVGPYKTDTTGLSTTGFAPPPKFRGAGGGGVVSPPPPARNTPGGSARAPPPSLPPSLPPRLPPRGGPGAPPPPSYEEVADPERGVMNQGALGRLGAAGVKVPGLGISNSGTASPPPPARSPTASSGGGMQSELQSRFARLNTGGSTQAEPATAQAPAAGGGTTWAQKQAALRTASNFNKDPSSVSLSDARSAASTANNFRERHGEQVASGWKAAQGLNSKYGIADRLNGGAVASGSQETGVVGASEAAAKKKPPPPPPAKKAGLSGGAPPPINVGTKPGMG